MMMLALALLAPLFLLSVGAEDEPKLDIVKGESGRIVVVRATGNLIDDGPRFLQAMTASGVNGHPVCLLVTDELTASQVDLLNRVPAAELVSVGAAPEALAAHVTRSVEHPIELFESVREAVVTSLHIADVYEAAPEAYRRGVPLIFGHDAVDLGVEKAWIVAARHRIVLPDSIETVDLSSAADRWKAVCADEDEPYFALATADIRRPFVTGTPLGGALLAADHRGMLAALVDAPVEFHYAEVKEGTPDDLDASTTWMLGEFDVDGTRRRVAVPQVGTGLGVGGLVPRWGDPIVDINGDGFLDPDEETVVIGETCRFGERDVSISLRMIGAIGRTKFVNSNRVERVVAVSPPAELIAQRLREVIGDRLPSALLVVGDHEEVPFDYVKDPVYAASMMHEQELATDNLYADPDGDGYLDIDVGRLISSSPIQATTLASRLATYPNWKQPNGQEACLIYPAWAEDEVSLGAPMIFANFEAFAHGLNLDLAAAGFDTRLQIREQGDLDLVYPTLATSSLILFAHHSGPDLWMFRVSLKDGKLDIDSLVTPTAHARGEPGRPVPFLHAAPLIVGAGCDSAGIDFGVPLGDSIVHAFLEQGAIAYVGNTRAGFPDTEEFLLRQMLQGALGLAPGSDGPQALGTAFRNGKNFLDLLIRERGPFVGVEPFADYSLPMRREWVSLVLYGDPALRLRLPEHARPVAATEATAGASIAASATPVAVSAWQDGSARIELAFDGELVRAPVLFTKEVGKGPFEEVTAVVATGLSYGNIPWAMFDDIEQPGPVGPGVFLDLPLPKSVGAKPKVIVADGPDWSLGGWRVVRDARGERRLLVSVDLVRYAMASPDEAETAERVVLEVE